MANIVRRSINHPGLFPPMFGQVLNEVLQGPVGELANEAAKRITRPAVNIYQDDNAYYLDMALPGISKKEVSISVDQNNLIIKSEKEEIVDDRNYNLKEFDYTVFERVFTLAEDVDVDGIKAKFTNGVLHLTIPKLPVAGPKKVEIG